MINYKYKESKLLIVTIIIGIFILFTPNIVLATTISATYPTAKDLTTDSSSFKKGASGTDRYEITIPVEPYIVTDRPVNDFSGSIGNAYNFFVTKYYDIFFADQSFIDRKFSIYDSNASVINVAPDVSYDATQKSYTYKEDFKVDNTSATKMIMEVWYNPNSDNINGGPAKLYSGSTNINTNIPVFYPGEAVVNVDKSYFAITSVGSESTKGYQIWFIDKTFRSVFNYVDSASNAGVYPRMLVGWFSESSIKPGQVVTQPEDGYTGVIGKDGKQYWYKITKNDVQDQTVNVYGPDNKSLLYASIKINNSSKYTFFEAPVIYDAFKVDGLKVTEMTTEPKLAFWKEDKLGLYAPLGSAVLFFKQETDRVKWIVPSPNDTKKYLLLEIPINDIAKDDESLIDPTETGGGRETEVDRSSHQDENIKALMDFIMMYAIPFAAFLIFIAVLVIGFKAIGNATNQNAKERMELMESFKNIIAGVIIIAMAAVLVTIAINQVIHLGTGLIGGEEQLTLSQDLDSAESKNTLFNILADLVNAIVRGLRGIVHGLANTLGLGYESIEDLIVMKKAGKTVSSMQSSDMLLAPFTSAKFEFYTKAYWMLTYLVFPLLLIAVLKVGIGYIMHSSNYSQVAQIKEDVKRILIALLFMLLVPLAFKFLLSALNILTLLIPFNFKFSITDDFNTGNPVGDLIGGVWLMYIELQLTFIFLVREIVLIVMYIISPLVVAVWAISNKTRLMKIWLGEIFTNASTQFIYALVFFVATIGLTHIQGSKEPHWLMYLLWLTMMIRLAKSLKDSLQGEYFSAMAGINEEGIAGEMTGRAMKPIKGGASYLGGKTTDKMEKRLIKSNGQDKLANAYFTGRQMKNVAQGNWKKENSAPEIYKAHLKRVDETNAKDVANYASIKGMVSDSAEYRAREAAKLTAQDNLKHKTGFANYKSLLEEETQKEFMKIKDSYLNRAVRSKADTVLDNGTGKSSDAANGVKKMSTRV